MKKRSLLTLLEGSFEQGFPAILQISSDRSGTKIETQVSGRLPPGVDLWLTWQNWQLAYRQMIIPQSRIKAKPGQITNISCLQLGSQVNYLLNKWLNQGTEEWQKIRDCLQRNLHHHDEIEILIQTSDRQLQQLPWHLWDFFDHYPHAEIALSSCEYHKAEQLPIAKTNHQVKILAIFGSTQGLDLEQDRAYLEQLSYRAEIKFLIEPQLEELNDQLWETGWDILFFAGHSSSEQQGQIWLNQTDILSLEQLKYALKKAIKNGLQLAIFNSCDGLGLARQLADLQLGQIVVMREPVPDVVAQTFLRYFLSAFAEGQSLYNAVRTARERLQKLETKYPYATWLPVIFQNPAAIAPSWQDLCHSPDILVSLTRKKIFFPTPLVTLVSSILATALVISIRQLGILEPFELRAFDIMMGLRPDEGVDPRLLLVTITKQDIEKQNIGERERISLSDSALEELLKKIEPYQPRVIGLDIYRDFEVHENQSELKTLLEKKENFVAVCQVGNKDDDPEDIGSPPEISKERLSFSNMPVDSDGVIRRQLLGMGKAEKSSCKTAISFSLLVAQLYLESENIFITRTSDTELQIGDVIFKKLQPNTGGYRQLDARGFQILLNYRSTKQIAQQVNLTEILNNSLDSELQELVNDRIILIGTIARGDFNDYFPTPYSMSADSQEIPGLFIQAHMVSQILSAVIDKRPLLWYLPQWGEKIWIWSWTLVFGMLIVYQRTTFRMILAGILFFLSLYGICFVFLLQGGWFPLVPSVVAVFTTVGIIKLYERNT